MEPSRRERRETCKQARRVCLLRTTEHDLVQSPEARLTGSLRSPPWMCCTGLARARSREGARIEEGWSRGAAAQSLREWGHCLWAQPVRMAGQIGSHRLSTLWAKSFSREWGPPLGLGRWETFPSGDGALVMSEASLTGRPDYGDLNGGRVFQGKGAGWGVRFPYR